MRGHASNLLSRVGRVLVGMGDGLGAHTARSRRASIAATFAIGAITGAALGLLAARAARKEPQPPRRREEPSPERVARAAPLPKNGAPLAEPFE